ncbi:hypothetical protein D8674_007173 [Pyrus ussuriensis x Pyrus communis]|uniref:Uncharacterized protein n=1 Tax=Pyrus ussuriensis x Pyrus communis TaxID=2448454 RepID=A0A5N5FWF0_9ROSA|nr:hypothetical protein D8674_007173 [Pyrus ussuriensis x Pyrus communis]
MGMWGLKILKVLSFLICTGCCRNSVSICRWGSVAIAAAERWGVAGQDTSCKPFVKRTNVHQNSRLAEAQDFVVAAVADLQISKKTTFLEGKSEERDIFKVWVAELTPNQVAGEEEDFARVVKVRVVSGGVGEGIARW